MKLSTYLSSPTGQKKINKWLAIFWFIAAFPICFFLSNSIPFLVFISVYAIVAAHWSGYISGRTDESQIAQDEQLKVIDEKVGK